MLRGQRRTWRWDAALFDDTSGMLRVILLMFLFVPFDRADAQTWLKEPRTRSCEAFMKCESGFSKLRASDVQKVEKLMGIASAKATEKQISERLGRKPFEQTEPFDAGGGAKAYKAMWSLAEPAAKQSAEHIDVLFLDGKAVSLRWYFSGVFKQSATVQYAE
jgi:hypothetical protein